MVEVLCCPPSAIPQDVPRSLSPALSRVPYPSSSTMMTREEHQSKEMNLRKLGLRGAPPKRSATIQDYSLLSEAAIGQTGAFSAGFSSSAVASHRAIPRTMPTVERIENSQPAATGTPAAEASAAALPEPEKTTRRPGMGAPRRSYSVMDYEPVPRTEQPSSGVGFADLPTELHYAIFDYLDPIDSTCIGLTSRHFYAVHKHFHGSKMALTTRRRGPNDVEWAWRLANQITNLSIHPERVEKAISTLESYAVRGTTYCRKCGASKCELHRHIKEWMGEDWQYCAVMGKFTRPAEPGAREVCYRRKPNDPHICGRHRKQKPVLVRNVTV